MKKLKQLLIIAFVSVLTFSFAACSSTSSCGGSDATLTSLSVDSSGAKTTYYVGDSFSADGIVVTAVYSDETEVAISSDDYTLDSSSYVSTSIGTYTIGISYTEGDITVETSYDVKVQLAPVVDLELNTSSVKTLYLLYQDISYSGLTATATYADKTTKTLTESDLTKTTYYDSTKTGKYIVIISYTYGGSTVSGTYYVEVVDISGNIAGLEIENSGKSVYTLSSSAPTANIDTSGISVYTVDENGKSATALDSGEYYFTYFNSTKGVWVDDVTAVTQGLYEVWANVDYDLYDLYGLTDDNGNHYIFTASNCVQVQVLDTLSSIALDNTNTDAVYTQEASRTEIMSSTWVFTLTFESGNTETRYGTDSNFTFSKIYPSVATTESSEPADVTYTFTNAAGVVSTASTTVSYTITGVLNEIEANITTLVSEGTLTDTSYSEETTLVSGSISVTAASSSTVSVDKNDKSIDGYSFNYRLKLGGAGSTSARSIKIIATGAATITVYAMSSSGNTTRTLALYDSDYKVVDNSQSDDGNAIAKYTYTIDDAGTYYIASTNGGMNVYYVSIGYSS